MTLAKEHMRAKIERASARLVQLQAREALAEMRRKTQTNAKVRRMSARRRYELGEAVADAGLETWSKAEITGLLRRAKDEFGESELTRKLFEAHGKAHGVLGSKRIH